jgi:16S rRNA C1402 (ribose-2'-O) methylase RsmI
VRGEIVLVVAGADPEAAGPTEPPEALFARLVAAGRTRREAVKETARRLHLPAREVYRRVLARE